MALLRDIHLATNHRVNAVSIGFVIKLDGAKKVTVIGHGHGGHLLALHDAHHLFDVAGAIEQRIVGVAVEVNERAFGHAWYLQFTGVKNGQF